MTRIEYNGGPDVFVGLSTEAKPTIEKDGISEGALVINRDTQTVEVFSGNESDGWDELLSLG